MNEWLPIVALGVVVFTAAATQRVAGMGFALVASPFLVALLGPFDGVLVANIFGALASGAILITVWRRVEYKKIGLLLIPAAIATAPGAVVAQFVPSAVLSTVIGALVILALLGGIYALDSVRMMGRGGAVAAGAVSGFMSVTAGVSGPAISAYAIATRWPHAAFAASVQLYFFCLGLISLAAKRAFPGLSWQEWALCGAALVVGIIVGHLLARFVKPKSARILVLCLAFVGAGVIITQGVIELLAS